MNSLRIVLLAALLTQLSSHATQPRTGSPGGQNAHWILQFRNFPSARVRRELARRDVRVLEDVPDNALIASFHGSSNGSPHGPPDLRGLEIAWTGQLTPAGRTAPGLATARAFLVVFHRDVARKDARRLLDGFQILAAPGLLPNRFLVAADFNRLPRLAALDEVSCILPGDITPAFEANPTQSIASLRYRGEE